MNNYEKILKEFSNTPDLVTRKIKINLFREIYIVYLETVTGTDKVNNYVFKNLINASSIKKIGNLEKYLAGPHTILINKFDEIEYYLTSGFIIILDNNKIYGIEARADINRSIGTPSTQSSINGPKDSFTENIQINIGLIKRRIKSDKLKTKNLVLGRKTKTMISIMYLEDIVEYGEVLKIIKRLEKTDIDGIIDATDIAKIVDGDEKTRFPTIYQSERPDNVAKSLLEGKIVIVVDTSTFVLIMPSFLIDFINPFNDMYSKALNINFVKMLRLFCFIIAVIAPAMYVALVNFNPETIPTGILINFAAQREGVPFPTAIEVGVMLIVSEILRESDLRFPTSYGSAISILGALILGEASVTAGIVSPIIIIIIAITFLANLIFSDVDIINALRHYRFIFLILASVLGLYGILLSSIIFIIDLSSAYTRGISLTYPLAPFEHIYFHKTFWNTKIAKNRFRSPVLTQKNRTRKGA